MERFRLSAIALFTSLCLGLIFGPYSLTKTSEAAKNKPSIKKIIPKKVKQGETKDIIIKGKRFDKKTKKTPSVKFSGKGITVNSVSVVSSKKIKANISVDSSAKKSSRAIKVINPNGKKCNKKKTLKITKGSVSVGKSTIIFKNKSTYSGF